jgi:hypothetical protein
LEHTVPHLEQGIRKHPAEESIPFSLFLMIRDAFLVSELLI